MKSGLKVERRRKNRVKSREKTSKNFFFRRFYLQGWNAANKSCLFYAKFFEFEEFSIEPFFCSSIQSQHAVSYITERMILWEDVLSIYDDPPVIEVLVWIGH